MGNQSKKTGGFGLLGWIVIFVAVVAVAQYFLFGTTVFADIWENFTVKTLSTAQVEELEDTVSKIDQVSQRYADDGSLYGQNLQNALDAEKELAAELKKSGVLESYRADSHGVLFNFASGVSYLYVPPVSDADSLGTSDKVSITSVSTKNSAEANTALLREESSKLAGVSSSWSVEKNYAQSGVTLDVLKNLGGENQILIWNGHGGYNSSIGCVLSTGITYDPKDRKQAVELSNGRALLVKGGTDDTTLKVAITSQFVKRYMTGMDGSLVYLASCHSGQDSTLPNAFLDNGATAVVGNSDTISSAYDAAMLDAILTTFRTPDESGEYPTLNESLTEAKKTQGSTNGEYEDKQGFRSLNRDEFDKTYVKIFGGSGATGLKIEGKGKTTSSNTNANNNTNANKTNTGNSVNASTNTNSNANGNRASNSGNTSNQNNGGQTAPMPSYTITEDMVIGYWSPDVNAEQPMVLHIYKENGVLLYRYYRVILGNGNGFNTAHERTEFEYATGKVSAMYNQGRLSCLQTDNATVRMSFYLFSVKDGVMTTQEDGTPFYRISEETAQQLSASR